MVKNVTILDCTKILEKNLVKNAIIASDRNIADDAIDANEKINEWDTYKVKSKWNTSKY